MDSETMDPCFVRIMWLPLWRRKVHPARFGAARSRTLPERTGNSGSGDVDLEAVRTVGANPARRGPPRQAIASRMLARASSSRLPPGSRNRGSRRHSATIMPDSSRFEGGDRQLSSRLRAQGCQTRVRDGRKHTGSQSPGLVWSVWTCPDDLDSRSREFLLLPVENLPDVVGGDPLLRDAPVLPGVSREGGLRIPRNARRSSPRR